MVSPYKKDVNVRFREKLIVSALMQVPFFVIIVFGETIRSVASRYFINDDSVSVRGIEITTNHVRSISDGFVFAKASSVHMGRTMQIWQINITDVKNNLISMAKLTTLTIKKK